MKLLIGDVHFTSGYSSSWTKSATAAAVKAFVVLPVKYCVYQQLLLYSFGEVHTWTVIKRSIVEITPSDMTSFPRRSLCRSAVVALFEWNSIAGDMRMSRAKCTRCT